MDERLKYLRRRLGAHKRRMRYWANLPGNFGPKGEALRRRAEMYELACDDADNIARDIGSITGEACKIVDVLRTFQAKWGNSKAPVKYLRTKD